MLMNRLFGKFKNLLALVVFALKHGEGIANYYYLAAICFSFSFFFFFLFYIYIFYIYISLI